MFALAEEAVRRGRRIPPAVAGYAGGHGADGCGAIAPAAYLPKWEEGAGAGWESGTKDYQGRQTM